MAVGTTGTLVGKSDIEVLIGDKDLWKELRTKLAASRVSTSMGVQEMTRQFLVEHRSSLDERKTELEGLDPESRQKSSDPHQSVAGSHLSLTNVFNNKVPKRPQTTRISRALSLNGLPLRKGSSMTALSEEDNSLADDQSTSTKTSIISISNLADLLPPKPPKKHIPKAKINLLKALDTASTLSYELRNSPGFARALGNLSENAESCSDSVATHGSDLDEELHLNKTYNMMTDDDDGSEDDEPLLVTFPAKPRSTTRLSVDRPPVSKAA